MAVGWEARVERARQLAAQHAPTADILDFYARLAAFQQTLSPRHPSDASAEPFAAAVDLDAAATAVRRFIDWLATAAPAPLAGAAVDIGHRSAGFWRGVMGEYLTQHDDAAGPRDDATDFIVEAVLQPFAEAVATARRGRLPPTDRRAGAHSSRCPACGSHPGVAVLREEGHGAKRALICPLCLTEWDHLRVVCPACDERRFDALPVYTSDTVAHARVDACDTCRRYLKTIDLTKDGLADPIADDLATLPLDLWAREQGYQRLRPNLLRL